LCANAIPGYVPFVGAPGQLSEFDRLDTAFFQLYFQQSVASIAFYLPLIIAIIIIKVDGVTAG